MLPEEVVKRLQRSLLRVFFKNPFAPLGYGCLLPRRTELHQIHLELGIARSFSYTGALSSTLQAFPRVFVHDGNLVGRPIIACNDN